MTRAPVLLWRGDEPLGPVLIADTYWRRLRGLLGRTGIEGGLMLRPAAAVHTIGMRFAIDVAYLDHDLRVLEVTSMARWRIGRPRRRARAVLETERGVLTAWGVRAGDVLRIG